MTASYLAFSSLELSPILNLLASPKSFDRHLRASTYSPVLEDQTQQRVST